VAAIFLSASVPVPGRRGYETADAYLIREAVSALVEVVLGRKLLVWGGHPAITPMIWAAAESLGLDYGRSVRLFQSRFFEDKYPQDNDRFRNVTYTEAVANDQPLSLRIMRQQMLQSYRYDAAVFIGGMEGLDEELTLFRELNADALILPVPSPGGVAKEIYEQLLRTGGIPERLSDAIDFSTWFYKLLQVRTTDARRPEQLEADARR
jgi:hypothetical protein